MYYHNSPIFKDFLVTLISLHYESFLKNNRVLGARSLACCCVTITNYFTACACVCTELFAFCNLISHSIEFERSGHYKGKLIFCWMK